jgi:hypothetical protein
VLSDVAVALPDDVLVGFTAATGGLADRHAVSNVDIRAGSAEPPPPPPPPTGVVPSPVEGGWSVNGAAVVAGDELVLTPADEPFLAGSAFYPTAVGSAAVSAAFDVTVGPGSGADGLTFVLADPAAGATAVGGAGFAMGFGGIAGVAVTADTYQNASDPSGNFVGVASGVGPGGLVYAASNSAVPELRDGTHRFVVSVDAGLVDVSVDGVAVLSDVAVALPDDVLVGFTAATGGLADRHAVSNVDIRAGSAEPQAAPAALRTGAAPGAAFAVARTSRDGGPTRDVRAEAAFCTLPVHPVSVQYPVRTVHERRTFS